MFEIYKSEFQRYRLWAGIATILLLGLFGFISKIKPFLDPDQGQTAMTYLVLISAGAMFGFIQMLLHRRANHWTYLIHRPLAPWRIYLGIALAGITVVAIVILVPWFIMVGGLDAFSSIVVDKRHYTWVVFLLFCVFTSYLVGSLAALNPSKGSMLLAITLIWLMDTQPENDFMLFFPMIVAISFLMILNSLSFKPDLSTYVKRPWAVAIMVVPMSLALTYGLSISTTAYYHIPKFIMGTHPDNNPVEGTVSYLWSLNAAEQIAYALEGASHPLAEHYTKQAELADFSYINVEEWAYPRRGQLYTMDLQYALAPSGTNSVWQFSHDDMLLIGHGKTDQKPVGVLGKNGFIDTIESATPADRFAVVPVMAGDKFLMTRDTIYQLDFAERHMSIKHQLSGDEKYLGQPQLRDDFVAIVTNKRTLMFDRRVLTDDDGIAEPDYIVEHPAHPDAFQYIDTYRLVDGFLLLYRSNHMFGFDKPGSQVIHARLGGEAELIHARSYSIFRHPSWIRHYFEMVGPAISTFQDAYFSLHRPGDGPDTQFENIIKGAYPKPLYWIAAILMILSPVIVFFMCRRHGHGTTLTATWVILCAALSLPALIAFFLMNPWRVDRPAAQ